ncbi:hypothetical protein N7510_004523 [Penicillium lagena]|uniref:uncharacterized protein n=1 Tax=Penicillium lagena TaxID=94218 RepID=UPI00254264F6|nr:uncharacterized protein N7510_004523 [Penicillium lagena]KAJ5620539.1 hypothetical protein N7510_004523 [Penicillium lagena]
MVTKFTSPGWNARHPATKDPKQDARSGDLRIRSTGHRDGRPDPKILWSAVPDDLIRYCAGSSGAGCCHTVPVDQCIGQRIPPESFVSSHPSGLWVFEILPRHNGSRQMPNSQMGRQRSVRDSRAAQINPD